MPVWGWILLIAALGALAVAAVAAIIRATQKRLPEQEPLHGDPANIAAPVPLEVAAADELTERKLEGEPSRDAAVR